MFDGQCIDQMHPRRFLDALLIHENEFDAFIKIIGVKSLGRNKLFHKTTTNLLRYMKINLLKECECCWSMWILLIDQF